MNADPVPPLATPALRIASMDANSVAAVTRLARAAWDRPDSEAYLRWRFEDAPGQEAAIALCGDECVATLFALNRRYLSADGEHDALELFDWYATEEWRPRGAGLRVLKHLMKDGRRLVALGGTPPARALFERLGWRAIDTAWRLNLPLRGRYFLQRGRGAGFSKAFDLIARPVFRTRARRARGVTLEPATTLSPAVDALVHAQRRFASLRLPDHRLHAWLLRAPAALGLYLTFHVRVGDRVAGWASARVHHAEGMRIGSLQEVFLADDAVQHYPAVVSSLCAILAGFEPDLLTAVTSCPDTLASLRGLRFRPDYDIPVYEWPARPSPPSGRTLADAGHAEWAFFPISTSAEASWLGQPAAGAR